MTTVVITGFGAVTPLGDDAQTTWQNMLKGVSGVHSIEADWAKNIAVQFAGLVKTDFTDQIGRVEARRMDRVSHLAVIAAREAWQHAGYRNAEPEDAAAGNVDDLDRDRLAVSVGTGIGGLVTTLEQWDVMRDKGSRRVSPFTVPALMGNAAAAHIGLAIGATAGVHTPVSACASGNEAISHGISILQSGRADVALVGGTESTIHPLPITAFDQMKALSVRNDHPSAASRPWDVDRDGFVLAEGAAMLVIETLEHAKARGAKIYGTLAGAGISADSHDLVQPDPTGRGQRLAMERALNDAGLTQRDVKHVNAHGTSTPQGDVTEAKSIRSALGAACDDVIVTSTKSMTGHALGAAGAIETLAVVKALNERIVPPTINLDNPEPGLEIDIAANQPRELPAGDLAAVNNSFGFGGHNVAVVVTNENVTE